MDIFGIGPLEFLLILFLALIVLGPRELKKTGISLGRELNKLVRSDTWRTVRQATQKMKNLPNELMREAGIEDLRDIQPPDLPRPDLTQPRLDPRPPAPKGRGGADGDQG